MKESTLKKIIIAVLGLLIIAWGLYKLSVGILITGAVLFILTLTLQLKAVTAICIALIKDMAKIDIIKEIAKAISEDMKESYPKISDKEIIKLASASSLGSLASTAADIVSEQIKDNCPNCGSSNVKEIEWSSTFDAFIEGKNILNKHEFKCNNCGNVFLQYDTI